MFIERRRVDKDHPFEADQEKFSTQRTVTYCLLLIFACTAAAVLYQADQSERSMVLQTIINLTLLAVGYWLGASKQGQDQAQAMNRMAENAPAVAAAVVAAAPSAPVSTGTMDVQAGTVNVETPKS